MNKKLEKETKQWLEQNTDQEIKNQPKLVEVFDSSSIFKYFLGGMVIFGICFICFLFVFQIILTQIGVIGYSMQPTINASALGNDGDINTDSVYYVRTEDIKYKDIVIIRAGKTESGDKIIKRVIATPGQTISFKVVNEVYDANPHIDVEVYVDGEKLVENYVLEQTITLQYTQLSSPKYKYYNSLMQSLNQNKIFSHTLGYDEFFIMGDNRNNSTDSRYFGPVKLDEIVGKVVLHIKHGQNLFSAIWDKIIGTNVVYA